MTNIDIAILVILGVSSVIGFIRGFTKEFLSISCWVGSTLCGLKALPVARPYMEEYIKQETLRDIACIAIVFVISFFVIGIISKVVVDLVKGSVLGGLDRTLGMVFGVVRGGILLYIAYAVGLSLIGIKMVENLSKARLEPYIRNGAEKIISIMPENAIISKEQLIAINEKYKPASSAEIFAKLIVNEPANKIIS